MDVDINEGWDCTDTLIDMVCYEAAIKRLSPEMEDILERHLQVCASCRQKVLRIRLDRQDFLACRNFG